MKTITKTGFTLILLLALTITLPAQEIFDAVNKGDLTKVKELIETNVQLVNSTDENGRTPLHLAANGVFPEIIDYLITKGADVNVKDNDGTYPIQSVVTKGNTDALNGLIKAGADINVKDRVVNSLLHLAINYKFLPCAEILLNNGADINAKTRIGYTPLDYCSNYPEGLNFLLLKGGKGDLNQLLANVVQFKYNIEGMKILLRNGADINRIDTTTGKSLLYKSVEGINKQAFDFLISSGADVTKKDKTGKNMMHAAAIYGAEEYIEILLKKGLDINSVDNGGKTPRYYSEKYGHKDVTAFIDANKGINRNKITDESATHFHNKELSDKEAVIWYLGRSSWAVKTRNKLLIFDYYNFGNTSAQPSLINGRIDPKEIANLDVYVFASHEHADHYDKCIVEWKKDIKKITYILGWPNDILPEAKVLGPKKSITIGDMEIKSINTQKDGGRENFLIKTNGLVFYHSGDYMQTDDIFKNDIDTELSKIGTIDFIFQGSLWRDKQDIFYVLEKAGAKILFPMHQTFDNFRYLEIAEWAKTKNITTEVICPEYRGDRFYYSNGKIN